MVEEPLDEYSPPSDASNEKSPVAATFLSEVDPLPPLLLPRLLLLSLLIPPLPPLVS